MSSFRLSAVSLAWRGLPLCLSVLLSSPANAVITANDDIRVVPQGTAVVIDVLANDNSTEPGISILSFSQPANGTVTNAGGALRYEPNSGFIGQDAFTYTIVNDLNEQETATVTVDVQAVDEVVVASTIEDAAPRAATTIMRSHREAVTLFMDSGGFASLNGRAVTGDQGEGSGDQPFKLGGVFVSVNHRGGEQDADDIQLGYEESLSGVTVGADLAWGPQWAAGFALGLSQTDIEFDEEQGDFAIDDISLLSFASYRTPKITVQAQLGYTLLDYAFEQADSDGNNLFAFAKAQYIWQRHAWQVIPAFSLSYQNHFVDAYEEAGDDPSSFSSQKNRTLQTGLSLHIDRAMTFSWGVLLPRVAVSMENIIKSGQSGINGFAAGQEFELLTEESDKSQVVVDLGASAVFPQGLSLFMNIQSFLQQEGYSSNTVQLGLRKEI